MSVGRRLRETAPAALIPAAWTVAALGVLNILPDHPVLVMHGVMLLVMVVFVVASWTDMQQGVLRTWKRTIIAGIPLVGAGTVGLAVEDPSLATLSFYGWMALPIPALIDTALTVTRHPVAYWGGATLCGLGVIAAVAGFPVVGIVSTALGQTAAIIAAVIDY